MVFTGEDYALGPYDVRFPVGITVVPLSISIIDDNIVEGNENFTLTFKSSVLPDNVILDDVINQSTVIIFDDDCKCTKIRMYFSIIYVPTGNWYRIATCVQFVDSNYKLCMLKSDSLYFSYH